MQVLESSTTQNGIGIQIENWKEDYKHIKTLTIAVYPTAKETGLSYFAPRKGERFRASIEDFSNDEEVHTLFNNLKTGKTTIEEIKDRLRSIHKLKEIF